MAWITTEEAEAITSVETSALLLAQANEIINLYANRTEAASGAMRPRDVGWLRRAVAFQAAWMASQPDLLGRSTFAEVSQDGQTVKAVGSGSGGTVNESSLMLAPFAARALKNLSWKTGSLDPLRANELRARYQFNYEASDDSHTWEALS